VEVDRVSGRRATEAYRRAGEVVVEYFAKGTEPIDMCPFHGALRALITPPAVPMVSAVSASRAEMQEQAATPESPAAAQVTAAAPASVSGDASTSPAATKKRGFWARVFGIGRDDNKKPTKSSPGRAPAASRPAASGAQPGWSRARWSPLSPVQRAR
jgi:hypothetical protein